MCFTFSKNLARRLKIYFPTYVVLQSNSAKKKRLNFVKKVLPFFSFLNFPTMNGPNFGHRKNSTTSQQIHRRGSVASHVKRDVKVTTDDHISPLHDPAGKPLRRHGTETIGDIIMHPIKELQMHHQRTEAYQAEKEVWDKTHEHEHTSPLE